MVTQVLLYVGGVLIDISTMFKDYNVFSVF